MTDLIGVLIKLQKSISEVEKKLAAVQAVVLYGPSPYGGDGDKVSAIRDILGMPPEEEDENAEEEA